MNLSNTIRTRRRAKEMTQEELAEVLGVSISAVSQWESDKTMPDITLIPTLCSVLEITSDELLGIDVAKKQEAIDAIVENAFKYSDRGHLDEGIEILEAGLKQYPDSFHLMMQVMYHHYWKYNMNENETASKSRAIELGEKILDKCTDDDLRGSATQVLCYLYKKENPERAEMLVDKMGDIFTCRDVLRVSILQGEEQIEARQSLMITCLDFLTQELWYNAICTDLYTPDEKEAVYHKLIALYHTFFENGDFGFYHDRLKDYEMPLAILYAEKKDAENTLAHLRAAADHAIAFVKYSEYGVGEYAYTSLAVRGKKSGGFSTSGKNNNAQIVKDSMSDVRYDFVRETEEFASILAALDEYAGEWSTRE